MLAFFAILIFFGVFLHRFWRVAFILPSVVFLFSTRSLSEYFIMMVALWLVSVFAASGATFTNGLPGPIPQARDPGASRDARVDRNLLNRRIVFMGGPTLAVVVCLVLALTSASPLLIELKSVQTNGQFKSIWQIQALVRNRSHGPMWPHFATDASGYLTTFWNVTVGPRELLPGQSALYTLVAPNVGSMPGVTQPFLLQAVTASPETISSSGLFTPEPFDCSITPSYFNQLLPLGSSVVLNVELRSPYGAPVHRGGVPIALSQVVYSQNALIPGEARINGAPIGQSPVVAVSDSNGRARFVIEDSSYQGGNPLYFQANVAPQNGFPYGYSEVVSIQWTPTS